MTEYQKTYRLDRLYHQFLKPRSIPMDRLPFFVSKLYEHGFIEVFNAPFSDTERYSPTEKLLRRQDRDELFKLIGSL
jgi:hypothetical protein